MANNGGNVTANMEILVVLVCWLQTPKYPYGPQPIPTNIRKEKVICQNAITTHINSRDVCILYVYIN